MIHAVVITGASKGFGRALAKAVAHSSEPKVHFVLSGRNQNDLRETESEIRLIRREQKLEMSCDIVVGDSSNLLVLEEIAESLFGVDSLYKNASQLGSVTFINNAGSLGSLCSVGSHQYSLAEISGAVNLNVSGCMYLTSEFVRRYEAQVFTQHPRPRATVVNISSLAAQQPFPSWGIYCAGKAARDMYHSVLAAEQRLKWENVESTKDSGSGEIRVLNYAPGPLDTKMQEDIREAELRDSKLGTVYTNMKEQNLLVDPLESAEKLLHLLRHPHSFRSGDHVDFYDELTLISGVHSGLKNC